MKFTSVVSSSSGLSLLVFALFVNHSYAQSGTGVSYKCAGNEYTDKPLTSKNGGCKLLEGGNVTIIQSNRAPNANGGVVKVASASQTSSNNGQRVDNTEQRARDSDSRGILEAELKKAEAKQAELLKEYNNGDPEKLSSEVNNNQKYLARVADMKANIARNDSDIAGIKRELGRNTTSAAVKVN